MLVRRWARTERGSKEFSAEKQRFGEPEETQALAARRGLRQRRPESYSRPRGGGSVYDGHNDEKLAER